MLQNQNQLLFNNNNAKIQQQYTSNNNENRRNIVVNGKTMVNNFVSTSTAPQRKPLQDIRPSQNNVIQPPSQQHQGWNTNTVFSQKEYTHFSQENSHSHFFPPKQVQQSMEFIKPMMLQQPQENYSLFENNPLQSSTDTYSSMGEVKSSVSTSVDFEMDEEEDQEYNFEEEQDQQQSRYQEDDEEEEDTTLVDYLSEEDEVVQDEEIEEASLIPNDPSILNIDQTVSERGCSEYAASIFHNLRKLERKYSSNPRYMEQHHSDINTRMREVLISWLNEVVEEMKLKIDTLYHTVNYLDRFLSATPNCKKNKLQLVGTTCCWIASKFYETSPPPLSDFVEITRCTYSREEFVQMEMAILNRLEFNLSPVTANDFVIRFLQTACLSRYPTELIYLSNYLVELSLQEYCMLHYSPSQIAMSAVVLALKIMKLPYWSPTMSFYSGYRGRTDLDDCLKDLITLHNRIQQETDVQLTSVRDKYCKSKYCSIAKRLMTIPMSEKPFE